MTTSLNSNQKYKSGDVFGDLTALKKANQPGRWAFRCACGRIVTRHIISIASQTRKGAIPSCGCGRTTGKDYTGMVFGLLTAIRLAETRNHNCYWVFRCVCGKEVIRLAAQVARHSKEGHLASCGCTIPGRRAYGASARIGVIDGYKASAKERELSFELTGKDLDKLFSGNCHYCGIPPSTTTTRKNHGRFTYNGIDRIDNAKGYTLENCVSCCSMCNRIKGSKSYAEFVAWINRLIAHYKNRSASN